MGKFVGLVGALSTFGAVAYLMAPIPQSATSASGPSVPATTTRTSAPVTPTKIASSPRATADPAARHVASAPAPRGEPTVVLVQQIQAELNRLGCYAGTIDGQWSDATQRAMQTLGERVSVLRPVDTPDYIMLALARSQTSAVCTPTQQRAAAPSRSRLTEIATPAITGPGQGEVRPSNGTPRVVAAQTARRTPSEPPKVWRAVPNSSAKDLGVRDAEAKMEAVRLKAARDDLNRVETRNRSAAVTTPADPSTPSSRPLPDASRMGLGVGPGDPLQAHIDPRSPNAPAILRGPPQPLPRFALQSGERPAAPAADDPASPARTALPPPAASAAPPPPARVASKPAKRSWQRTIFTDMRFNGP
jgi:peptidoglycan hydrolase-like protein with peptidoglycan-binding domain